MRVVGIANILHRETIATLAGEKAFKRGVECFNEGRVLGVESARGELAGLVKPQENGRAPYEVRIWVREDGLAFECSCPIGASRQFCKHTIAVTLAHLEKEKKRAEQELAGLREGLMNLSIKGLMQVVDGLVAQARQDPAVLDALKAVLPALPRP